MQIRTLKTFNGRMGLVRAGLVITVDDRYAAQLISNKLAIRHEMSMMKPSSDKNLGDAPQNKNDEGNEPAGDHDDRSTAEASEADSTREEGSGVTDDSKEDRPTAGQTRPLSSRQVGRRSRKKT